MSIFNYDPTLRMAFSDDPLLFPDEDEASNLGELSDILDIEEGQTYFLKFYSDKIPIFIENAVFYQRKFHANVHELNFKNFVGLSRIGNLNLKIHNKKITNDLYESMLDELAAEYASLIFSFSSPVGQHYSKSGIGRDSAFLDYLFLKKYLLNGTPDIDSITNIFLYNPHRKLEKELLQCPIQECDTADSTIVDTILNSSMVALRHEHFLQTTMLGKILEQKTGKRLYPANANRENKFHTFDTNENRFIKFFLQELLQRIEIISKAIGSEKSSYFNPDIHNHLDLLNKKINHFLTHSMWQEVGQMRFLPANSQVLQRREGYRELFSLYSLLQLSSHCDFAQFDFENLIEIKNLPTLYEYWCFFQIKTVIDSFSTIVKIDKIVHETPIEHKLSEGLCIGYENGVDLYFNKTYPGSGGITALNLNEISEQTGQSYSHYFRPDIIIEKNNQKLIFDAKYKGKRSSGFYCENEDGTIQSWKNEDIDKMHTYREAIKNVSGSFILFPGKNFIIYPAHDSSKKFEGVGALPIRPSLDKIPNTAEIENIKALISEFLDAT